MTKSILTNRLHLLRLLFALAIPKKFARSVKPAYLRRLYHSKKFKVELGKKSFFLSGTKNSLENSIFFNSLTGCDEGYSLELFIKISEYKKDIIFWDVGANSGVYTLVMRCINENSIIVAFEPAEGARSKLIINLKNNNYSFKELSQDQKSVDSIIIVDKALSSSNKTLDFHYYNIDDDYTYGGRISTLSTSSLRIETVKGITAKAVGQSNSRLIPNFLKIDIEGFEYEALLGFGNYLKNLEVIFIEILSDDLGIKIESLLSPTFFRFFDINDKDRSIREFAHLRKSSCRNWLVIRRNSNFNLDPILSHYIGR